MKLKYYLRGLGIGIVVTAIIMSFTKKPEELTDAQIKIRAAQLGMVEKSVLADIQKENDISQETVGEDTVENVPEADTEVVADNTQSSQETLSDTEDSEVTEETLSGTEDNEVTEETLSGTEDNEVTEETLSDTEDNEVTEETITDTETTEESGTESIQEDENVENYIIISVNKGNGSEVVSQRLFEAGLVNSASEYNRYLIKNGYDRVLRVGNHEIPAGASEEEIAKILCGMK